MFTRSRVWYTNHVKILGQSGKRLLEVIFKIASKMAAESRKCNIFDCMVDKTEIPSAKHTFLWSRNTFETRLITICCPITKFAEIVKMASKMAAENRQFNISDCMTDKTEIPSAKHTFLWSRNAMETKRITMLPIAKFAYKIWSVQIYTFPQAKMKSLPVLHNFFLKLNTL